MSALQRMQFSKGQRVWFTDHAKEIGAPKTGTVWGFSRRFPDCLIVAYNQRGARRALWHWKFLRAAAPSSTEPRK